MIITPAGIAGSWLVEPALIRDERGFFARAWDAAALAPEIAGLSWPQANLSGNERRGTIRGLHWQVEPYGEAKLLRCVAGAVYDVAVDLRSGSPTYGQWQGVHVSAALRNAVLVPAGCAHGYQALEDGSEVLYQVSHPYVPGMEHGIRWNDPAFRIEWPITENVIVSLKDSAWPDARLEVSR